jgi:hypothetical protein
MRANKQPRLRTPDVELERELREHAQLINRLLDSGTWDRPLNLAGYSIWVSVTAPNIGSLMIKSGVPTGDNDGTVVGTQT